MELEPYISQPHMVCHLEFADFVWHGNGPEGPVSVGVERKRLDDFLHSMTTGRLVGRQLVGMLKHYDYSYVLVEGIIRPDRNTGILQSPRNGYWRSVRHGGRVFMAREVYNFINTLQVICGVPVVTTSTRYETSKWLGACYSWWQKVWARHKSYRQIDVSQEKADLREPGITTRILRQFPGIGEDKARKLGEAFPVPSDLFNSAGVEDLIGVEGIGKVLAQRILNTFKGAE